MSEENNTALPQEVKEEVKIEAPEGGATTDENIPQEEEKAEPVVTGGLYFRFDEDQEVRFRDITDHSSINLRIEGPQKGQLPKPFEFKSGGKTLRIYIKND